MSEAADHLNDVVRIYRGSNGDATLALYKALEGLGSIGTVAVNLFRAQKCSERAKVYRGGGYKGAAYDRKQWSIDNLTEALLGRADLLGMTWGWGDDPAQPVYRAVLYLDLPTGQVSFHTAIRGPGPDYPGAWDGRPGQSADRICRWVARLLAPVAAA